MRRKRLHSSRFVAFGIVIAATLVWPPASKAASCSGADTSDAACVGRIAVHAVEGEQRRSDRRAAKIEIAEDKGPITPAVDPEASKSHEGHCSGDSCGGISLSLTDNCVWARNGSDRVVRLEIRLADQVLTVNVEAADGEKAREAERKQQEAKDAADACVVGQRQRAALLSQLEQMRQAGVQLPPMPEIEGPIPGCPAQPVAGNGSPDGSGGSADQGVHHLQFDALFSRYLPVYDLRLTTPKGCISTLDQILSYSANSTDEPKDLGDSRLQSPSQASNPDATTAASPATKPQAAETAPPLPRPVRARLPRQ